MYITEGLVLLRVTSMGLIYIVIITLIRIVLHRTFVLCVNVHVFAHMQT